VAAPGRQHGAVGGNGRQAGTGAARRERGYGGTAPAANLPRVSSETEIEAQTRIWFATYFSFMKLDPKQRCYAKTIGAVWSTIVEIRVRGHPLSDLHPGSSRSPGGLNGDVVLAQTARATVGVMGAHRTVGRRGASRFLRQVMAFRLKVDLVFPDLRRF